MTTKTMLLAALLTLGLAGPARGEDPIQQRDRVRDPSQGTGQPAQDRAQDRQRLRDPSLAGGGASSATRATCDGTARRDRLQDGTGGGSRNRRGGRR